jgi:hypothetical protein
VVIAESQNLPHRCVCVLVCHSFSHTFSAALDVMLQTDTATFCTIEVKFEPEHVTGVEPRVEPITADVVDRLEKFPDGVEITSTKSSSKGCKNTDKDHKH